MATFGRFIKSPFSFLFAKTSMEERVVAYILREHARGRAVSEILDDRYVQNRLTPQQQSRLFDRPEVIHALGHQDAAEAHAYLAGKTGSPSS